MLLAEVSIVANAEATCREASLTSDRRDRQLDRGRDLLAESPVAVEEAGGGPEGDRVGAMIQIAERPGPRRRRPAMNMLETGVMKRASVTTNAARSASQSERSAKIATLCQVTRRRTPCSITVRSVPLRSGI